MSFFQTPHALSNTFQSDLSLRLHLERIFPGEALKAITPQLQDMGELAAGPMLRWARQAEDNPPKLTHFGPFGRRIDRIDLSAGWQEISNIAAKTGLVAIPYEKQFGWRSRVFQFAMLHLFSPSSAYVCCPLAMSDGAVAALKAYGEGPIAKRAIRNLTSRDPERAWTSGQWMTEKEGGSDVSRTSTTARFDGQHWRLYGTKYFTSATTSQCTLALARPEGAPAGSRALALFYIEPWRADGTSNHLLVNRLKDKLGTRALPTAELHLNGTIAHPIGPVDSPGIPRIATVLNIARYFNVNGAVSSMRRCIDLAVAYARVREAFGHNLLQLPLHVETLAGLQVDYDAALAIGVRLAELLGKVEAGAASQQERATWRLLTPLAKLGTGKQVVAVASETLEAFGGAGYIEDTDIPRLLRDAQVLPIWEGTTNVLSLDALRAIRREGSLDALLNDIKTLTCDLTQPQLSKALKATHDARDALSQFAEDALSRDMAQTQTTARAFAISLYKTYAAALLCNAAAWELEQQQTRRLATAAQRWTDRGLVSLFTADTQRLSDSLDLLGVQPG